MSLETTGWSSHQRALLEAMGLDWPEPASGGLRAATEPLAPPTATSRTAASTMPTPSNAPSAVAVASVPPVAAAPAGGAQPVASARLASASGSWATLADVAEAVRNCQACGLCASRKQAVPGIGNPNAHWMVVGEGPGEHEDLQGEPFVGRSGELLDAMLAALNLTRAEAPPSRQVFIANTVKCRPPGNRNPSAEELAACAPFLQRQLQLVKPRIVLALGRFAAQTLLSSEAPVGSLRGKVHRLADGTPVVVSYHPSYLLRQPLEKARAWDDWCRAAEQVAQG